MIPFNLNVALVQGTAPAALAVMAQETMADAKMEKRKRKRKHR